MEEDVRRLALIVCAITLVFALAACGKDEKAAQPGAGTDTGMAVPPAGMGGGMPPAGMPPAGGEGGGMPPAGMGGGMPPAGMGGGMPPAGMGGGMPPGMGAGPSTKQVVIPPDVAKTWKKAKIVVKKKGDKEGQAYEVAPGGIVTVGNLSIEVGQYLPDFSMDAGSITSKSAEPINPTAKVVISEGGKVVYQGWAFEKYPEMHAFQHPEYSVTLAGGVK